jgi:predicted DNA-binding helix-hairpin-helix protein
MDTIDKLKILSEDSQYDLACACGSNKYDRRKRAGDGRWLYPVPLPQGGYSVLLKTLLSNVCNNDCKYCPLRSKTNVRRCTIKPENLAKAFMEYLRRREVHGLFLSSGVIDNPDRTMQMINDSARIIRQKYKFKGFMHLKVIPGASDAALEDALSLASAVSLNIETPGQKHFRNLSNKKDYEKDIIRQLKLISKLTGRGEKFSRVKASTQFIVGASDERDSEIVKYTFGLYNRLKFQRVYYSAYQPGLGEPDIPGEKHFELDAEDRLTREHRLYQSDFLMRQYGFGEDDILFDDKGNLDLQSDPKQVWADSHPENFPVNINRSTKENILKVPGIGPTTANRIIKYRGFHKLYDLNQVGVIGKLRQKAMNYIVFS